MSSELYWLTLSVCLLGLSWLPYILQLIVQQGVVKAVWDPTGIHPHDADWAHRAARAHNNAVENMAVFAPLVLIVEVLGLNSGATAIAAIVYFCARVAHYIIYTAALPVLRTLAFAVGVGCQAVFALRIFGII